MRAGDEAGIRGVILSLRPVREDPSLQALQEREVQEPARDLHRVERDQFGRESFPVQPAQLVGRLEHPERGLGNFEAGRDASHQEIEQARYECGSCHGVVLALQYGEFTVNPQRSGII